MEMETPSDAAIVVLLRQLQLANYARRQIFEAGEEGVSLLRNAIRELETDADVRVCSFTPVLCWLWNEVASPLIVYAACPLTAGSPEVVLRALLVTWRGRSGVH